MLNTLKNYKFDILWFLITILIILSINISYMYSRDRTLSTVEWNQFKLFTNIMHVTSLNFKTFTNMAKSLTIPKDKTRQALFHIALITPKGCRENGSHQRNHPLICETFPTSKTIKELLKNKKRHYKKNGHQQDIVEFSTEDLGIYDSRYSAYLIKKRANRNKWIVAKKRYKYRDSDLKKLYFFLALRYLQTTSISSKFKKTKFSAIIILLTSLLLWLLFKSKERKNARDYSKLINKSQQIKSKIIQLDQEYNDLKNDIFSLEEEIKKEELIFSTNDFINTQAKKKAIENIRRKTIIQTQKNETLIKLRDKIIQLEAEGEAIENLLNEKRTKLRVTERNIEYKKISSSSIALKQLWRHEPTWTKRKQIETTASLTESNLPFTLTQAFISFERHIDNEIEDCFEGEEQEEALDKTLIKKINIIIKCGNMSLQDQDLYHRIRKARNKWVHGAIYPSKELLNDLLIVLEDTDITPPL